MNPSRTGVIHSPIGLLLGAAVSAAIGAGVVLTLASGDPPTAPMQEPSSAVSAALEEAVQRLDQLEQQAAVMPAQAQPVTFERVPAGRDTEVLDQRITALEMALQALKSEYAKQRSATENPRPQPVAAPRRTAAEIAEENRQRIANGQQTILDPSTSEKEKLEAWSNLRRLPNAWNDAVVAQMVRIGLASTDPSARADVWRQADGRSQHDAMVPALLQALQTDSITDVREEAAETLVDYADRPAVLLAIQQQLSAERDDGVRRYLEAAVEFASRARKR